MVVKSLSSSRHTPTDASTSADLEISSIKKASVKFALSVFAAVTICFLQVANKTSTASSVSSKKKNKVCNLRKYFFFVLK
jgi:hypothetical protein